MTSSLEFLAASIDQDLRTFLRSLPNQPTGLYTPIRYALSKGGKRIRPLLTLVGADLFGKINADALFTARAVELFHNFTLIHDDIMDNSPIRRGQATVFKKFGSHRAILSGDVLFTLAFQQLNAVSTNKQKDILEVFTKTAIEVCEGQEWDMSFEKMDRVRPANYLQMIRQKTAVLLGASLQMGALVGGADRKQAELLYRIGCEVGLVFQIKDDLLDSFGSYKKTGKRVGQDILSGKKTWLSVTALHLLGNGKKGKDFLKLLHSKNNSTKKIGLILAIYKDLGLEKKGFLLCSEKTLQIEKMVSRIKTRPRKKKALIFLQKNLLTRAG